MSDTLATQTPRGGWEFDDNVTAGFDKHVSNSVAGYNDIQNTVVRLSDWFAPDNAVIADIGCSTGTTLRAIQDRNPTRVYTIHAYDKSAPMMRAATKKLANKANPDTRVHLHRDDITKGTFAHTNADLTIAIFTIQFLPASERGNVLANLCNATKPGGVLLLAEKTIPEDPRWAMITAECSWEDKKLQGIPSDEIVAKAESLRGVLRPQREQTLILETVKAGWAAPQLLWGSFQWRLYGFIKPDAADAYQLKRCG